MMQEKPIHFLIVVLIAAVIWFTMLGHRDLFDADEGRYAEIPAAMVDSGDWITPRLNGVKYFEKPVLQYWATAVVFSLVGKSSSTARFYNALAGFLCALFSSYLAVTFYGGRAAKFTFLFTISSLLFVTFGHFLTLDMTLSTFLVFGIGSLAISQHHRSEPTKSRNWMLAGWAALACAVLTKGLIGVVLPVASVVVYSAWQRDAQIWKNLHIVKGVILFLLIAAPWFVLVSRANPEFAEFFFIHEHWDRYTSGSHHREGPVYYFILVFMLGAMPWLISSLSAVFRPVFNWQPQNKGEFDAGRLLWTFAVFTFVFYSLGRSKLPAYILPIFPVVAILAAKKMAARKSMGADRWGMAIFGLILFITALNLGHLATDRYPLQQWDGFRPWLMASGALLIFSSAAALVMNKRPLQACSVAAVTTLLAFQMIFWGAQSLAESNSGRIVAEVIKASAPEGTPVFTIRTFSRSVPFYLGRTVTPVEYTGELEFGLTQEPNLAIHRLSEFLSVWHSLDSAALIINSEALELLFAGEDLGKIVYRGPKKTVVIKS